MALRLGVNRNDLRCMEVIQREQPISPKRLSEAGGLSPAAVTKVLDRLERAGFAERVPDADDRRSVRIIATDNREDERRELWREVDSSARAVFDRLSPSERELVTGVLSDLEEVYRSAAADLAEE